MISSKTVKTAILGLLCAAGTTALTAQIVYDREQFWSQPHIVRGFLGSYEVNPATEPQPNQEEQVVIRDLIAMMKQPNGGQLALQHLLPFIKPKTATAPGTTAAYEFIAAGLYAEQGDMKNSIKYYQLAIDKFPGFLRAIRNVAIMKVREGQFEGAIKDFTKAIELGAKDNTVFGLLGLCYVNTEKFFNAETAYREAIILDPTVKDWQLGLAKSLLQQRKYNEGIAVLEQLLLEDPENEILWSSQANAYLGLDDAETTVAIQEIVDRLGKSTPDSLILMGSIYMSRDLHELALHYYRKALEKDPNQNPQVHVDSAELLAARGAFEEARAMVGDVRRRFSAQLDDDQTLRLLRVEAEAALALNEGDKVIPILEQLIEKDPLDGQALLMLAEFNSNQGIEKSKSEDRAVVDEATTHFARADLYFERVAKISKFEVRALISWARSYVAREQFGKAIPHLERAQVLDPQDYIGRYLDQVRKVHLARLGV